MGDLVLGAERQVRVGAAPVEVDERLADVFESLADAASPAARQLLEKRVSYVSKSTHLD
jgi:hypothetical protein